MFIPPYATLKVTAGEDWVALGVFLAVAVAVGALVTAQVERRRGAEAREADLARLYDQLRASAAERDRLLAEARRAQVLEPTVCDEAERLDRIVANLLSMSRIEAGAFKPDRQAVDVDELVGDRVRCMKDLFRKVWGPEGTETQYLRVVYASQLRKKLRDDPERPRLVTEPGVGYRLLDRVDPRPS